MNACSFTMLKPLITWRLSPFAILIIILRALSHDIGPVYAEGVVNLVPQKPVINQINPLLQALAKERKTPINSQAASPNKNGNNNLSAINQKQTTISKLSNDANSLKTKKFNNNLNNIEEPVTFLDYSSINDEILHKTTASFVYFNANFNTCKHCFKFFSVWNDLAHDIRWWRHVIRLYTINCSDEDNINICRRAGATQFPQVRYYWVMSNSLDQDGHRVRILGKSVHAMRHLIMDKVMDSYIEHKKLLAQRQKSPSSIVTNPLVALMPILARFIGQSNAPGSKVAGGGGLASIINLITNKGSGGDSGPSIGNLLNQFGGFQGISQMIDALSSFASMRKSLSIQPLARNWPDLDQSVVTDARHLMDTFKIDQTNGRGVLLLMETQEFLYTGLETILDLGPYNNSTRFARVRDEQSQLSKNLTNRDDIQAPALIYLTPSRETRLIMAAPKYTNDEDLRRAFVRSFERKQIKYPVKRVWTSSQIQRRTSNLNTDDDDNSSQENGDILKRVDDVHMNDLIRALLFSLREQVYKHSDLSDDQYNALVKYVYILINYFPFDNDERLKFAKRLHTWLQNQVSPMDINEYKKQFHDVDEIFGKRDWVACKSLDSKVMPGKSKRAGMLFESPAQFGKIVSNITHLFRSNRKKMDQLKGLLGMFAGSTSGNPVMLDKNDQTTNQNQNHINSNTNSLSTTDTSTTTTTTTTTTTIAPTKATSRAKSSPSGDDEDESQIKKVFKSLSSDTLGSDSSILKIISSALGIGDSTSGNQVGGISKFAREYPCGIWKLAHVIIVNEYIKDSPRKDVKHIVIHSLHEYMKQFYACPTCGNRVSDVSGEFRVNLDDHLADQGDSVMMIWKFHNRINKRLESEQRLGVPPKEQFPNEKLCPKCRAAKTQNDLVSTPNWQEKQVLSFLVHHYRPQNIIDSDHSDSSSAHSILKSHEIISKSNITVFHLFSFATSIIIGYIAWHPSQVGSY